jgi:hypothetical protein
LSHIWQGQFIRTGGVSKEGGIENIVEQRCTPVSGSPCGHPPRVSTRRPPRVVPQSGKDRAGQRLTLSVIPVLLGGWGRWGRRVRLCCLPRTP